MYSHAQSGNSAILTPDLKFLFRPTSRYYSLWWGLVHLVDLAALVYV